MHLVWERLSRAPCAPIELHCFGLVCRLGVFWVLPPYLNAVRNYIFEISPSQHKEHLSGRLPYYDPEHYAKEMKRVGAVECEGNIFWLSDGGVGDGAKVRKSAIEDIIARYYTEPGRFHSTIVVAVPNKDYNPMEHLGALTEVSPIDNRYCFVKAILASALPPYFCRYRL